jgi:hypothetical protein
MTILFIIAIIVLVALLVYQNDRTRQWISDLFSAKNGSLLLVIALLTLMAFFYPGVNDQIKKLKQKLNH